MKIEYNKLIRDKIPEIIQETGKNYQVTQYDEKAYKNALLEKLVEEANEVRNAPDERLVTELADLLEVFETILKVFNLSDQEIMSLKEKRLAERGGFLNRLRLLWVDD
jgi:predicted house-cleaning noncanonical NTP pyrophosphatase (MazG superfamily)